MTNYRHTMYLRKGLTLLAVVVLLLLTGAPGTAKKERAPETLIVTAVKGDVTYIRTTETEEPQAVYPFLKLEDQDLLTVPAGARINLLYINRGLGETWQGPKTLQIESSQCYVLEGGEWRKERPDLLRSLLFEPQKVLAKSALFSLAFQAGATARALPVLQEIPETKVASIEKTESILRKEFGEGDATPDLYLLSILAEHGQYERMGATLQNLLTMYPNNSVLLAWQKWVNSRK
jgi:hypothetical protein